jgi:hypothetical protein
MSEYQYYEFQAVDRPLTPEEQAKVSSLSSRTTASAYSASFVYHWSDLPANEEDLLVKYFDALLYLANWGTSRLLFRFPRSAIEEETLRPYCHDDGIHVKTSGGYIIFDMSLDEEAFDGWVEGEGWLSPMMELRQDILNGDFRAPYLAWLKIASLYVDDWEGDPDLVEPPVPPNLAKRSRALDTFCDFFRLDDDLVQAAAEGSSTSQAAESDLTEWVPRLPEDVKDDFLLRLLDNEPALNAALTASKSTRTIDELLERAEAIRQQRKEEERRKAEAKRQQELDRLARRIPQLWEQVFALIGEKRANAYDQAVAHLVDLRDLARRDGWEAEFQGKINQVYETYPTLRGLHQRMKNKGFSTD